MPKFLEFLGVLFDLEKLKKFEEVELRFQDDHRNREFFSKLIGRYSLMIQPELDEDEVADLIEHYLRKNSLCIHTVHEIGQMIQSTMYRPKKDLLN